MFINVAVAGERYKRDAVQLMNSALASGGVPNSPEAYTINGEPGDFYDCSRGILLNGSDRVINYSQKNKVIWFQEYLKCNNLTPFFGIGRFRNILDNSSYFLL